MAAQASHKRDQALDLFLGEIGVWRHGAGFADRGASAHAKFLVRSAPAPAAVEATMSRRVGGLCSLIRFMPGSLSMLRSWADWREWHNPLVHSRLKIAFLV